MQPIYILRWRGQHFSATDSSKHEEKKRRFLNVIEFAQIEPRADRCDTTDKLEKFSPLKFLHICNCVRHKFHHHSVYGAALSCICTCGECNIQPSDRKPVLDFNKDPIGCISHMHAGTKKMWGMWSSNQSLFIHSQIMKFTSHGTVHTWKYEFSFWEGSNNTQIPPKHIHLQCGCACNKGS